MDGNLFRQSRNLNNANLVSNICINEKFSEVNDLAYVINERCKATESAAAEPNCEVIEKCLFGKNCCRLSKFKSVSRLELKELEEDWENEQKIDVIQYNSNPDVEYLLKHVWLFSRLKVYDASNCAVREIFWSNFEMCDKLEHINLANNQITSVVDVLFYRMPLKTLNLCK